MLRPHPRVLPAAVHDVKPLPDGRLAALTPRGVLVLDGSLQTVAESPGTDVREDTLSVLPDGRFLVRGRQLGDLLVGAPGAPLEKVDLGEAYSSDAVVTRGGFFAAVTPDQLLVDSGGDRRIVPLGGGFHHGLVPWEDGALAAGYGGIAILDAGGAIRGRREISLDARPAPFAGGLLCSTPGAVVLLDAEGERARLPVSARTAALVPAGTGFLRADGQEVTCWALSDGRLEEVWRLSKGEMRDPTALSNGHVVMSTWARDVAWIRDAQGVISKVPLPGALAFACAFGDGVAMSVRGSPDVLWWRPGGGEVARLGHDTGPWQLWEVPAGFVSAEEEVLYLWQEGADGPELPELSPGDIPFDTPIVMSGAVLTVRRGGRFALRGVTPKGGMVRVRPGTPFRRPVTREQALSHIQALISTRSSRGGAATTPDASVPGFEELGMAVGASPRSVVAGIRAGRFPLEPPRPVAGHEYIGWFLTSGDVVVSDPCYLGKRPKPGLSLSRRVEALPGRWHAFVRPGAGEQSDRTAELVAIHETGFGTLACEPLGGIGVDSGRAGVFDKAISKWDSDAPLEDGIFSGQCAVVSSGYGDGYYSVFGGSVNGKLAKIRVHFLGPTPPELDTTMAVAPASSSRAYSPAERFQVGETVEHKKFGAGVVTRVEGGKMDVQFGAEARTLVCAR